VAHFVYKLARVACGETLKKSCTLRAHVVGAMNVSPVPRVVLLCGGKGTRLEEVTDTVPKPLVPIGGKPIIWHIMKHYAHYGYTDFILATGHMSQKFEQYWRDHSSSGNHVQFDVRDGQEKIMQKQPKEPWTVLCADTGPETNTGERILMLQHYLKDAPYFLCTYGDGVSDVDINEVIAFHKKHRPLITLVGTNPFSRFGELRLDETGFVTEYKQKPRLIESYINAGFMVMDPKFIDYLKPGMVLEDPFPALAQERKIAVYRHNGFWHCVDTRQERDLLAQLWNSGKPPWRVWND
jgi:glucose-1-phosphate cytidylyltransferase